MSSQNLVPFHILSVDSLGQGVSKITDKITFVPKTLPGEEGIAQIISQKSKIAFARVEEIKVSSSKRVTPSCEHFKNCPGCHYLHTDYSYELELKLEAMKSLFRHFPDLNHQVISSHQRLAYRNRMQLHYDLVQKKLGLMDARSRKILEIPHCQIANSEVTSAIKDLYSEQKWIQLAPPAIKQGHVEIYFHEEKLKLNWNRPYAEGGFTQVHEEMNQKLKQEIAKVGVRLKPNFVLDLFAGDGNLSNNVPSQERLCVDIYQKAMPKDFHSLNIYGEMALKNIARKLSSVKVDLLILDPPRSGLKNLEEWLEMTEARHVIYVSCDPHTQVRDTQNLKNYQIKESFLLDLFPSTFHFETMLVLERKN